MKSLQVAIFSASFYLIFPELRERNNQLLPQAHGIYQEAVAKAKIRNTTNFPGYSSPIKPSVFKERFSPSSKTELSFSVYINREEDVKTIENLHSLNKMLDSPTMLSMKDSTISDVTNRDNIIPYAYFFKFFDKLTKSEDEKIKPEEILNNWKLSLGGEEEEKDSDRFWLNNSSFL